MSKYSWAKALAPGHMGMGPWTGFLAYLIFSILRLCCVDMFGTIFRDFMKTKKMRDVRTIILAAVSRRDLCYVSENEGFCFGQKPWFWTSQVTVIINISGPYIFLSDIFFNLVPPVHVLHFLADFGPPAGSRSDPQMDEESTCWPWWSAGVHRRYFVGNEPPGAYV